MSWMSVHAQVAGNRGNRCVRSDKDTGIGVAEAMKMHLWKAMFCQKISETMSR